MWHTSVIFKKLPKVRNHPMGEKSPNLVTLTTNPVLPNALIAASTPDQGCQIFLGTIQQNVEKGT
jgi:hypothetical protein